MYSIWPTTGALNFESIWRKITTVRIIPQGNIGLMDPHSGYFWSYTNDGKLLFAVITFPGMCMRIFGAPVKLL